MQDKIPEAMPTFFENWCSKFDDNFNRGSQRSNFQLYLAGLLGETERKKVWAIASSILNGNYHSLHHFIHDAPWSADEVNLRRLEIPQNCTQRASCVIWIIPTKGKAMHRPWRTFSRAFQMSPQTGRLLNWRFPKIPVQRGEKYPKSLGDIVN